jgi:DNA-binding MarR family transcriptional regulator
MSPSLQHEIYKRQPFDSPEQEAFLNVLRTQAQLTADVEAALKPLGLSIATYNVLRILRGAGDRGRMCHEIGEHMVTRVPDVTRLVDRLEKEGRAVRERSSKDRRVVHVKITPMGESVLAQLDAPVMQVHKAHLGHLSAEELARLSELLVKARYPAGKSKA